ncbi:MAG: hypothetical protein OXC09_06715 [Truepera sp.]|nr:hypothetical protein [Truepera sp.]
MKRLIILLFASLMSFGLLVACSQAPGAQPMNGDGNGDGDGDGDGMPMPMPPMPANLDLTLLGWTDRGTDANAGMFTWELEIDDSGAAGVDVPLFLVFTDGATDLSVNTAADTACAGLGSLDPMISGLTISFSGDLDDVCALIDTFDHDADADTAARATAAEDELAFEITLAGAPMTTPVASDDYELQKIDVTGTVMVTGGGDDDEGSVTFDISGTVEYMPPTVTTQKAN